MLEGNCCICGEYTKSVYCSIKHLDNGKSRIYSGHKRCLFLLDNKLEEGKGIEYEEIETPLIND